MFHDCKNVNIILFQTLILSWIEFGMNMIMVLHDIP